MILLKHGVSINECRREILIALITKIAPWFEDFDVDCVITSASENFKHSAERSKHYCGDALDIRSRELSDRQQVELAKALEKELRDDFVVILEKDHFHIHYAPRR